MRIAIITTRLTLGGLETHMVSFINELLNRGHQILLSAEFIHPEIEERFKRDQNLQIITWTPDPVSEIKKFGPDLIHAHPFSGIIRGFSVAQSLQKPFFLTMHGLYDFGVAQGLEPEFAPLVKAMVVVDDGVAECLSRHTHCPEKIKIVRNGIDLNCFYPLLPERSKLASLGMSPEWFSIVTVSRFESGKDAPIIQLLQCAPDIAGQLNGLNLILVGDGLAYQRVADEVQRVLPGNKLLNIKLTGRQSDVREFLQVADLVVACDRAALEAMACQRPVLAASAAGFAGEIDGSNYQEVLFFRRGFKQVGDRWLTEKVIALAGEPQYRDCLSRVNVEIIKEHFDIRDAVSKLEALYQQAG